MQCKLAIIFSVNNWNKVCCKQSNFDNPKVTIQATYLYTYGICLILWTKLLIAMTYSPPSSLLQRKQLSLRHSTQRILHREDQNWSTVFTKPLPHGLHQGLSPLLHSTTWRSVPETSCSREDQDYHDGLQISCQSYHQWLTSDSTTVTQSYGQFYKTQGEWKW